MSEVLEGCREKIKRADEHADLLRDRLRAYGQPGKPVYYVEYKYDSQTRELIPIARDVTPPPLQQWGVIVGDVVHNLRSALDHLVWGLSVKHSGPPPPDPIPRDNPWRQVSFPIYLKPHPIDARGQLLSWTTHPPDALTFVWPGLLAEFQQLQPFTTGQSYAEFHPLWVLNELWNTDKHRTIALLGLLTTLYGVERAVPPHLEIEPSGFREEDYEIMGEIIGELKNDAPLAHIRYHGHWTQPGVPMKLNLTIQLGLDERPSGKAPKDKLRLGETLQTIRDFVAQTVEYFGPELTRSHP